jgi:hypothetical protein
VLLAYALELLLRPANLFPETSAGMALPLTDDLIAILLTGRGSRTRPERGYDQASAMATLFQEFIFAS